MSVDPVQRLILELGRLPGIGERTAARLAFHIVRGSRVGARVEGSSLARDLAEALLEVDEKVGLCRRCQNLSAGGLCGVCTDTRREAGRICVVQGVADLRAIEATGAYRGGYHVLHGALAPLDGIGPGDLKIEELMERLGRGEAEPVAEVILATNADVEGDATALYLARLIAPLGITVTRPATGIPTGGELEYIDQATLGRALRERRRFES